MYNFKDIEDLNNTLKASETMYAEGYINDHQLTTLINKVVRAKIQLAGIKNYRELTSYINLVYSLYMNGEITDREYEVTNAMLDEMVKDAFNF
jgi:hypothetical protein